MWSTKIAKTEIKIKINTKKTNENIKNKNINKVYK